MAISNINGTNSPQAPRSISATNPAPAVSRERSYGEDQPATIVTLSPQARRLSLEQPLVTREPVQPRTNLPEAPPRTIPDTRKTQDVAVTHADLAAVAQTQTSAREAAEAPARRSNEQQVTERKRINTYA